MIIERVDDIFYHIGLSVTSTRDIPSRRNCFYHPLLVLSITSLVVIQKVIAIFIDQDNHILLNLVGSPDNFPGKIHINWFIVQFTIIPIFSQIIYYYNHVNGVEKTFIKVFKMMSGSLSPTTIGLKDHHEVFKLLKITRILNWVLKLNNNYNIPILCFLFYLIVNLVANNILDSLVYGVPNSLLMAIWGNYCMNIFGYQFLYFYIICLYCKIKIREMNMIILKMTKGKRFIQIENISQTFDALYREINEYNATYWSKFLFNIWLNYGTAIIILMIALAATPTFLLKLIILYPIVIHATIFLFIILKAASVNSEANKSYRILNSLLCLILVQRISFSSKTVKNIIKVITIRKETKLAKFFYSS